MCVCVGGGSNEANTAGVPWEDRVRQEFTDVFSKCENKLSCLISFYQSDLYKYTLHSVFISTQSLLLCSLKAPHDL